jgi:hypothetical protein
MKLLSPETVKIDPRNLDRPIALFSVDVETDYGTGRMEALSQIDRFVDLMAELGVPWTAFIEGRLFETRPDICRLLRDRGVDLELHCYDHGQPGDTAETLGRSAATPRAAIRIPRSGRATICCSTTSLSFRLALGAACRLRSTTRTCCC